MNKQYIKQLLLDYCGYEFAKEKDGFIFFSDIDYLAETLERDLAIFSKLKETSNKS